MAEFSKVKISELNKNPYQPRKELKNIPELAENIKAIGLITPIKIGVVNDKKYIIAGDRRVEAYKKLGIPEIFANIETYDKSEMFAIESLIENLQREGLTDVEQADSLKKIQKLKGITKITDLCKITGLSESFIRSVFDSSEIRKDLEKEGITDISYSVISETKKLPKAERIKIIKRAKREGLGGRHIRKLIRVYIKSSKSIKKELMDDLEYKVAEKLVGLEDEKAIKVLKKVKREGVGINAEMKSMIAEQERALEEAPAEVIPFEPSEISIEEVKRKLKGYIVKGRGYMATAQLLEKYFTNSASWERFTEKHKQELVEILTREVKYSEEYVDVLKRTLEVIK